MTSLNLALLLHRQFAKYLPEMPPQLSVSFCDPETLPDGAGRIAHAAHPSVRR
jgi:hypothetical protein